MNIQIIVHSATGHTLSVAKQLEAALLAKNHLVNLTHIIASNEETMNEALFTISPIPSCEPYDLILIGAPVRAFSATPAIKKALKQITGVKGKKCILFTTEQLPMNFMGGNQAIKKMKKALTDKGALVLNTSIIHWNRSDKSDIINTFVNSVVKDYTHES